MVCLSFITRHVEGPAGSLQSSLLQVLVQGLVLGMRHLHFNEPGMAAGRAPSELVEVGASCRGVEGFHVPPDARRLMKFSVCRPRCGCAFALGRRESLDAILAHLPRSAAIATTVETRIVEARDLTPALLNAEVVLRRTLTTFQERLVAAEPRCCLLRLRQARGAPTTPPPRAPPRCATYYARAAGRRRRRPGKPPADAEEIARLEARLEGFRRRANAPMQESDVMKADAGYAPLPAGAPRPNETAPDPRLRSLPLRPRRGALEERAARTPDKRAAFPARRPASCKCSTRNTAPLDHHVMSMAKAARGGRHPGSRPSGPARRPDRGPRARAVAASDTYRCARAPGGRRAGEPRRTSDVQSVKFRCVP